MRGRARHQKFTVFGLVVPSLIAALAIVGLWVGAARVGESEAGQESLTSAAAAHHSSVSPPAGGFHEMAAPVYGMTVDDVSNVADIVAAAQAAPRRLTTRIVFDEGTSPADYAQAVTAIHPHSDIMGALVDSESLAAYTRTQHDTRMTQFLSALATDVDIWEIGNEVNGNWTGDYADVSAKISTAYTEVEAAGKQSALTLYYNIDCGNGPSELDPLEFSRTYVPTAMREGLDYVFLSYYEGNCHDIRPSETTWQAYFDQLRQLYPSAKLGFGEVGLADPATSTTIAKAQEMLEYYYGLRITTPGYVGGYFWWYAYEDFLPTSENGPLWQAFVSAIKRY